MSPDMVLRLANPDMGPSCPVATLGAKLARAITAKNEAEQASLIAPKGTREANAASWRHETIQGRVHSLEDQNMPVADAALLALCAEFQRLNARLWNLHLEGLSDDDMERVGDEVSAQLSVVGEALIALPPATTAAGMWARIGAVIAWKPVLLDEADYPSRCLDERLVAMVLRELAAASPQ